jgi:hypothetical protein
MRTQINLTMEIGHPEQKGEERLKSLRTKMRKTKMMLN